MDTARRCCCRYALCCYVGVWLMVRVRIALCADTDVQWHLVKKGNEMACVRSGDLAAMFWKGPADQAGISASSELIETDFAHIQNQPSYYTQWRREGWSHKQSINNMADPVFDVRWNDLKEIVTRNDIGDEGLLLSLPEVPWRIHVSVRTRSIVQLLLCDNDSLDPSRRNCYGIQLAEKHTGMPSLWRCVKRYSLSFIYATDELRPKCSLLERDNTKVEVLKPDIWNHFTLNWNGSELSISVFGEDTPFLKWNDPDPFSLQSVWGRSLSIQPAYWRVHDYVYYETNESAHYRRSIKIRQEIFCLDVIYRMSTKGSIRVTVSAANVTSPELKKDNTWHEARFESEEPFDYTQSVTFQVVVREAAIGFIALCLPDRHASVLKINGASPVTSCSLVADPTTSLKIGEVDGTDCPGCKQACLAAGLSTSCKNTIFCFPTANHTQSCSCLQGYGGPNCINLTGDEGGDGPSSHLVLLVLLLLPLVPLLAYHRIRLNRKLQGETPKEPGTRQERLGEEDQLPRPLPRPPLSPLRLANHNAPDENEYTYIVHAPPVVMPEDPESPPLGNPPATRSDVIVHAPPPSASKDEEDDVTASTAIAEKEATQSPSPAEEVAECGDELPAPALGANERTPSPSTAAEDCDGTIPQPITAAAEGSTTTQSSDSTNDDAGPK